MSVLALTLAGPLQAWGAESRFTTRGTEVAPTKSGVIGLLAAAKGLRRTDPLEDLANLRFAVRLDQPGEILRDFQTARSLDGKKTMPLSYRFYRADARFLVGLEADRTLLESLVEALVRPVFPLYLGRRSCPPSEPFAPRILDQRLDELICDEPWLAAPWWRRRSERSGPVELEFRIDAGGDLGRLADLVEGEYVLRDVPMSFSPERREYGWRTVCHGWVPLPADDDAPVRTQLAHDPFASLE